MRLLHTSDWHLGRSFHGSPLLEHQVAAIDTMVEIVRSEGVELVVVAGDLYDRQLPPADAVEALSHAVCELRAAGARIVAISGNHDSSVRLGFAEPVLGAAGVTIRGDASAAGRPVVLPSNDGGPDVAVYPIPYLDPEVARHRLGSPETRSHDGLLRLALDRARADLAARPGLRSVAVAHAFVAGGAPCDSERALAVGGAAEVSLGALAGFQYVALGHLHGRQVLGDGRARYSGSPLPYSFSERAHVKGVWLVELQVDGSVAAEPVDLPSLRPLAVITGPLEDLLSGAEHGSAEAAWVHAVLTDPVLPPEAMARLRRRFPHAVSLVHEPPESPGGEGPASYADRVRGRTDLELALDFVEHVTGSPAGEAEAEELTGVIGAGQREAA